MPYKNINFFLNPYPGIFLSNVVIILFSLFLVPSAPADIKVVTSGETSSIVSWRAPALPNGIIQKYTVYRREVINGEEVNF